MLSDKPLMIALTPHNEVEGEAERIVSLLDSEGFDYVHLRHPDALTPEVKRIIEDVPHRLRKRLRLHGHFELAYEFNLGGLHLNGRCPYPPRGYNGSLSLTCHSLREVKEATASGRFDYVTLSPIFESISKPGYGGHSFTDGELHEIMPEDRVVALGGITPQRIDSLKSYNFAGYAMLGSIWDVKS